MKRRSFLQMVAGMFGAASVGAAAELLASAAPPTPAVPLVDSALGGAFRLFYNVGTYRVPQWVEVRDATSAKLLYDSAAAVVLDVDPIPPSAAYWMAAIDPGSPAWTGPARYQRPAEPR